MGVDDVEHFWPSFPFIIQPSQGLPLWWDLSWWIFQIVIMCAVLYLITRWAVRVDRDLNVAKTSDKNATPSSSRSVDM